MPRTNELFFVRLTNRILQHGGVSRVLVADTGDGMVYAPNGLHNIRPIPRIIVCLKGRAHYEFAMGGKTQKWEICANEAIFVPAYCWLHACYDTDYDSLGVVFYQDITRILLVRSNDAVRRNRRYPFNLNRRVLMWPRPLSMEGQIYLKGLARNGAKTGEVTSGTGTAFPGKMDVRHRSSMNLLLDAVLETLAEALPDMEGGRSRLSWQAACAFVQEHLHLPFGRGDVADFLKLHPNHISRLFTQFSECSFAQYVMRQRMDRARAMLADPRWNITEVSLQCGFTSLSYFSRVCHAELGLPPSEFRQAAVVTTAGKKQPK
ncbi:AraC family transcriptional regulator [Opitutaceae bacterium TAV4]|nr:AraC family transcriptional regulator [Opitutaceae bacterium TAV4]RRJ99335.1 AraC family transcriptional regulator [Opitutaceae bacterium TAV3]